MTTAVSPQSAAGQAVVLPKNRGAYYAGAWHEPKAGRFVESINPGTGQSLGKVADSGADDIDAAVGSAKTAFAEWRRVLPLERAKILRRIAEILRQNANELAMIDAADCGNPVKEMVGDAMVAAAQMEFFAGFVTEMKGASIPMGPDAVNFSVREPLGVVGRIIPFNHPFMFCAGKSAAPLAAGNTVIVKPPDQAPLSSLRLAELIGGLLPPGAFNVVPGGQKAGQRLASHPDVAMIALIGSVPTGRAVMKAASDTVKRTMLELGGKNGFFIEPTVFAVTEKNRIAREEIFGPVLGVFKWRDEAKMLATANAVEYGLTASIWTNDLNTAHRTALTVQAGYVWINEVSKHFLGAPFGGFKQSGLGREECFEEMLAFTQEKNIHIRLKPSKT